MFNLAKNKLIRGLTFAGALASTSYFVGCGKDNGITDLPPTPEEYVLESNAHELDTLDVVSYDSESGEVIFSDNPNLRVGDVFIAGASESTPGGLLRKIQSVDGNSAQTSRATINDATKECDFHIQNIRLVPANKSLIGKNGFDFEIPAINAVLYDADNNQETTNDQITLEGGLSFNLEVSDFDLVVDASGLEEFNFDTNSSENLELRLNSKTSVGLSKTQQIYPDIYCAPIPVGPFILVPVVEINATIEGEVSVSNAAISQTANLYTGIDYSHGEWTPSSSFTNNFDFEAPTFSQDLNAKVSIGPKVKLLVYDLAGISSGVEGYLRAEVNPTENPWWKLFGGVQASVGANLEVFGWPIAEYSTGVVDLEELLAQAETLPEELVARLNVSPNNGVAPLQVLLDASQSSPQDLIKEYSFQFGDGEYYSETLSSAPDGDFDGKTTHVYSEGNFTLRVAVKDNLERIATATSNVSVEGEPIVSQGKIAFVSYRDGNHEIYTINPDGSNLMRLTNNLARDISPAWSPDGSKLAFVSSRDGNEEIYIMDKNGNNLERLTNDPGEDNNPSWSPDGSKISFSSNREGRLQIYILNLSNMNDVRRLTNNSFQEIRSTWSPDGYKLAFDSYQGLVKTIYVINEDGSNQTEIMGGASVSPSWSPDGNKIAYVKYSGGIKYDLCIMDPDGSDPEMITNNSWTDSSPSWSPNGNQLTFFSNKDESSNYDLYIIDSDGLNLRRLTNNPAYDTYPAWGPE